MPQSRFCHPPDDSVRITPQFSSLGLSGWSGNGGEGGGGDDMLLGAHRAGLAGHSSPCPNTSRDGLILWHTRGYLLCLDAQGPGASA